MDLTYFVDATGFSKPVCPLPKGGMHWIESRLTLPDGHGIERLLARVGMMPDLDHATEWDLMIFDDVKEEFEPIRRWDIHDPHQSAHPFQARVDGTNYYYIFPDFRVPEDLASVCDLSQYEAFSCLAGDGKWRGRESKMDREETGRVRYTWRKGADRLYERRLDELVEAQKLQRDETWARLFDFETGALLSRKLECEAWNQFRKRWIAFFTDKDKPGEVWFAEADTPLGPWGYGRRVVTHGDYNFYNVAHHPSFNQDGSRIVYFEGTYSDTFSGARTQTPRYDYNQIMYRLSLDDTRLVLPVAVYRVRGANGLTHLWLRDQVEAAGAWERVERVAWFALPPHCREKGLVPVCANDQEPAVLSTASARLDIAPVFAGLPLVETESEVTLDGLWNCRAEVSDGGGPLNFPLQMPLQGTTVRVGESWNAVTGIGRFDQGKLELTLTNANEPMTFTLEARVKGRTLEGEWRENNGLAQGTWSASRADRTPPERRSPALAVLREYRRAGNGGYDYSIEVQPPPGCLPEGRPICRVWKVPGSVLTLDWKAQPVPGRRM